MSQANVEIVRRVFEAWDSGDLAGGLASFDDGLVIHPIIGPDWHGPEGVIGMAADWIEGLAEWSMTADEFEDAGDRVVVRVHQTGLGETSGVPVESDYWFAFTLSGGKIVRWDMYAKRAEALEAAGLSE
jgi:ketosteroid isomerase-like protein